MVISPSGLDCLSLRCDAQDAAGFARFFSQQIEHSIGSGAHVPKPYSKLAEQFFLCPERAVRIHIDMTHMLKRER